MREDVSEMLDILKTESLTINELSKRVNGHSDTVKILVYSLVRYGLLGERKSDADRRIVRYAATEKVNEVRSALEELKILSNPSE
jgi:DNA-binding MarR family transcriptional regulator